MLIDGLTLSEGSSIQNLSVDTGTSFPNLPNAGEMFYRTDLQNAGLYVFNGTIWDAIATAASGGSVSSVSITTANGVSGFVVNATSTPAITLSLGAITPTSISTSGSVTAGSFIGNGASLSGIASAAALATARTISTSGDGVMSVSFDGSSNVSSNLVLATVNSLPQSDAFRKISVNGKGLVTSTTAVAPTDIISSLGFTPANKSGDTLTGALILDSDPVTALGAVTKRYVDNIAAGLTPRQSVITATTAPLPTCIYSNGSGGVGATLTGTVAGALGTIGGYASLAVGNRVLVKNQATPAHNGIYVVSFLGDGGTQFVLTRAPEFDNTPDGEISAGDFSYIQQGTLAGTQWVQTTPGTITVGSTSLVFSQLTGAGVVTGGNGISVAGNVVSNSGVLSLVAGTNISLSSSTGNVTVNVSGTVGAATSALNLAGGSAGTLGYQSSPGVTSMVGVGTTGQVLTSNGTSAPSWTTIAGSLTIGSTNIALGATSTTLAGLTSVTSTSFVGALTGNAATATSAGSAASLTGPAAVNGADGWFRSSSTAGWYSTDYAVGIYATEAGNVRTYNGANFISSGTISGTNLSGTNTGDETLATIKSKLGISTLSGTNTGDQTNISGNAATATSAASASTVISIDNTRDAGAILPITSPRAARFDFVNASTTGTGANYAGVMTYVPYDGNTVGGGGPSYQVAYGTTGSIPKVNIRQGIDSTWGSWHTMLHTGNFVAGVDYVAPGGGGGSGGPIGVQTFTTSGTYTPTPGTTKIIVEAVGAGGRGGTGGTGGNADPSSYGGGGGGGGGGGSAAPITTVAVACSTTQTVTISNTTTSLGSLVVATNGNAGSIGGTGTFGPPSAFGTIGAGGAGGATTAGMRGLLRAWSGSVGGPGTAGGAGGFPSEYGGGGTGGAGGAGGNAGSGFVGAAGAPGAYGSSGYMRITEFS